MLNEKEKGGVTEEYRGKRKEQSKTTKKTRAAPVRREKEGLYVMAFRGVRQCRRGQKGSFRGGSTGCSGRTKRRAGVPRKRQYEPATRSPTTTMENGLAASGPILQGSLITGVQGNLDRRGSVLKERKKKIDEEKV